MPAVPTYDEFQVAPTPLPDARLADVQPGNGALQLGEGLQKLGGDMLDTATRLQHQENADAIFRATAAFNEDWVKRETELKTRTGQNAWGVATDAANDWQQKFQAASDGLQNNAQRQLFARSLEPRKLQMISDFGTFEAQQRRTSVVQSADASIASSINAAAANPTDDSVAVNKQSILNTLRATGATLGWTPDIYEEKKADALTNFHLSNLHTLVDQAPEKAAAYLAANRGEIEGTKLDDADKLVRTGTLVDQSQKVSDAILARHPDDEAAALADVRRALSGEVRDKAELRVRERFSEMEQIKQRDQKDAADELWKIALDPSSGLSNAPPSLLNRVSGETLKAVQNEAARRARGENAVTDWSSFYRLNLQSVDTPNDFAALDLRNYQLAPAQFEQLVNRQTEIKKGGASELQSLNEQLTRAYDTLGWGPSDEQKKGQLASAIINEIGAEQRANGGKKLTFDQREKIVDRMIISTNKWFSGQHFYDVAGTEDAASFVPKIPDAERQKIESALRRAGKPISDETVLQLYKLKNGLP